MVGKVSSETHNQNLYVTEFVLLICKLLKKMLLWLPLILWSEWKYTEIRKKIIKVFGKLCAPAEVNILINDFVIIH